MSLDLETARALIKQTLQEQQAALLDQEQDSIQEASVITFELDDARLETDPKPIGFPFRSIHVFDATDSATNVLMKVNTVDDYQGHITLKKNTTLAFPRILKKAYIHWAAQSGKSISILLLKSGKLDSGSLLTEVSSSVEANSVTSQAQTSDFSSAAIIAAANNGRKVSTLYNDGPDTFYIGSSGVDLPGGATPGIPIPPGQSFLWKNTTALYAIGSASSTCVEMLEE